MISLTQVKQEFSQALPDMMEGHEYIFKCVVDMIAEPKMPFDGNLVKLARVVQLLETADRVYKTGTLDGVSAVSEALREQEIDHE